MFNGISIIANRSILNKMSTRPISFDFFINYAIYIYRLANIMKLNGTFKFSEMNCAPLPIAKFN